MAETVSDNIDVAATAGEVFRVATDFESYPDWNANIKKVEVRATDDEDRATEVFYEVDAKVKTLTYTLGYDYSEAPGAFSWDLIDGDVKELSGSYRFEEFDDVTEVQYETKIDPGFPIPGFLKRQGERQIVKGALQDLKKRVESRR
ncbi:MAG TPA: SRPBCC family protein [Actinomycetota bacterium]|nr:SRPBCC family protein [Actinomycetota bacterium]